jgi:2',3'-cyclic-nucleotide 2'-phosphodiesterase (5'-nucleotidase family)
VFFQRMAEARFPLYAANLRGPDGAPLPNFKDRAIVTFDGVRLGFTGATYDDTARSSSPEDLRFAPTVATTKEQAETLRREGADFVVAVVHADRRQDYAIMGTGAVDLLLTGHDHDLFINYNERVAAVESSYDAHYVTAVDVTIEVKEQDGKRATTWRPSFRVIDTATVTPDPEVAAVVANFEQEFTREMDVPLGTTAVELDSRNATVRTREAAIGGLIADAMRASVRADVAVMNGGGIRGDKIIPPGELIRRDVYTLVPFNNAVVKVELTGAALRQMLEHGLAQADNQGGGFLQVSGVRVSYVGGRPAGNRIVSLEVGGKPVDANARYTVATIDFIANGGDGQTAFRGARVLVPPTNALDLPTLVLRAIETRKTIAPAVEGRLRAVNARSRLYTQWRVREDRTVAGHVA